MKRYNFDKVRTSFINLSGSDVMYNISNKLVEAVNEYNLNPALVPKITNQIIKESWKNLYEKELPSDEIIYQSVSEGLDKFEKDIDENTYNFLQYYIENDLEFY